MAYPCPECGSATYLGIFIPTVEASFAEWHGWSFKCHNRLVILYGKDTLLIGIDRNDCEPCVLI